MRLHRDNDPGQDEPDDGWTTAGEAPSGTLSDVFSTWSVVRRWRGIKARTPAEAFDASRDAADAVEVRASRQELAMLYLTRDELGTALSALGAAITDTESNLTIAQSEAIKSRLRADWATLNALRTAFTEARWSLMTDEEIEAERTSYEKARAAGLIR